MTFPRPGRQYAHVTVCLCLSDSHLLSSRDLWPFSEPARDKSLWLEHPCQPCPKNAHSRASRKLTTLPAPLSTGQGSRRLFEGGVPEGGAPRSRAEPGARGRAGRGGEESGCAARAQS